MDRKLKLGLLLLAFAAGGFAQIPVGSPIQGPPVDLEGAGTVTDVSSGNLAPLFTVVVSNPSTVPAFAFTLSNAAGTSWFGNAAGTSGAPSYNTTAIPAALIPNPSASTLGGIESLAAVSHQWINTISTSGVPSATQPAFTDLSGSNACGQLPALTGDTTTSAGSCATTTGKLNGVPAAAIPFWQKVTVGFASLTAAALTQTINLVTTAARTKVCGVSIKTTTAFSGGTIASLTVSVGDAAGTGLDYAPAFTVFSASSNTNYQDTIPATVASKTSAASTITALFTSTVGNLNDATAGSVDIDVCTAVIP